MKSKFVEFELRDYETGQPSGRIVLINPAFVTQIRQASVTEGQKPWSIIAI